MRIDDDAAADRERGRIAANDEAVAGDGHDRGLEANLHEGALPRLQLRRLVDEADGAEKLGGEVVEADACLLLQRFCVSQKIDLRCDHRRRAQRIRWYE